jgi:putative ABC transport system substrate-binding protein
MAGTVFHQTRRKFLAATLGAAAWPIDAKAQHAKLPVLGVLGSASAARYTGTLAALQAGLSGAGLVDNKTLHIEYRWADFKYERLPALAAELVNIPVDAIFATGSVVSALAAKAATSKIPVIFANGSDPVEYKLVDSLSHPGGNVTGMSFINGELGPKRIQLLKLLIPNTTTIAVLVNPKNPNAADADTFKDAGRKIGVEIVIVTASTESEIRTAFARAAEQKADALMVHVDALFNDAGEKLIVALAAEFRLPTMTAYRDYPARGGLISYGPDTTEMNRQAAGYVARVLRGEKPADLPVVQPAKFALRINLKTAKALGLSISDPFLLLADEVIE